MSTLGYGDLVPVTPGGRVVSIIAIFVGIILVALLTAMLVGRLVERVVNRMGRRVIGKLSGHILILGWNENGLRIISELQSECGGTNETIVVMADRERIDDLPASIIFVSGDSTRLASLKKIAPGKAKVAVVLADQSSGSEGIDSRVILTTMALQRITDKKIRIICEVISAEDLEYLEGAGASEVIVRSTVAGDLISRTVHSPGVATLLRQILTSSGENHLERIRIPKKYYKKTFDEFLHDMRLETGSLPVALIRDGNTTLNPSPGIILNEHDEVFIIQSQRCG